MADSPGDSPGRATLEGMVAIVTGAGRGIGESIAHHLAREGATVVIADIDVDSAERVAASLGRAGLSATTSYVDVADRAAVGTMVEETLSRFGRIDILVNNGGLDAPLGLPWEIDAEHWRRVIDVDLTGQWWCTQAVLGHMIERGFGKIIFISSVNARLGEWGTSVAYNAAKAGLIGLTIGLAAHVERFGIRVNAIAPGPTGTGRPMTSRETEAYETTLPWGVGGPEPVAEACLYLVRPSGNWVSGTVLNVSGGLWRG